MDGIVEVINLLGTMIRTLQQQLTQADRDLTEAKTRIKDLEEVNARMLEQARKREGK